MSPRVMTRAVVTGLLIVAVMSPMSTQAQVPFGVKKGAGGSGAGRVQRAIEEIDKIAIKAGSGEDAVDEVFSRSQGAIKRLGRAGAEAIPQIEAALGDPAKDWKAKAMLCEALGQMGDERSVALLGRIVSNASQPEFVRGVAGAAAARTGRPSAEPLVKRVVENRAIPVKVRARVMMAVGASGMGDAAWLGEVAQGEHLGLPADRNADISQEEFGMILNAQRALAVSKDPRAVDVLIRLVDKNPSNAILVESLGKKKDPRAVPVLIKALKKRPQVSNAVGDAAIALGEMRAKEAVDAFIEIVQHDPDYTLVSLAAQGLAKIGDKRALSALQTLVDNLEADTRFPKLEWKAAEQGVGHIPSIRQALEELKR